VSSRTARAIQRNPVSEKKKKRKRKRKKEKKRKESCPKMEEKRTHVCVPSEFSNRIRKWQLTDIMQGPPYIRALCHPPAWQART
jgi:ubiquitin